MNRYLLHIAWFDIKLINQNLTSVQNALKYSTTPTEIVLVLNEQTFIDSPEVGVPSDMWKEFMNHPIISQCQIIKITNDDKFTGISKVRRDYRSSNGLTCWGESDCFLPLEFFYITENFQKSYKERPYVMTFATRKMWGGWELIEHPSVVEKTMIESSLMTDKNNIEEYKLHFSGPLDLEWLYEFNEKQSDPEIVLLPKPRIEGALTVLSDGMPEPLLCPTQDFIGEDFCLEMSMAYYNIPQFHVRNILKGHDSNNPFKRTNVSQEKIKHGYSNVGKIRKEKETIEMHNFIQSLYQNKK